MAEHRVLEHLGLAARDYDAAIRRYIPAYDEMIATVIAMVTDAAIVIDLGTGTGALAGAILGANPAVRVKLVDIDPAMLEAAGARVAPHRERAELVCASFDQALPLCDAVVASLALHHVPDLDQKCALYARVRSALRPGGVLIIADITVHEDGPERVQMFDAWAAWMASHGIARAEADRLFAKWAAEDRYYSIATELALLSAAGFERPECFWKHGPSTVFGAFR